MAPEGLSDNILIMAKFSRLKVYQTMEEIGILPVFYHSDIDVAKQVVKACYEGGVRAFEFTNRGDFAHEVFADLVKWADKECPQLILGIRSNLFPNDVLKSGDWHKISELCKESLSIVKQTRE